jgi:hypothetical protein
MDPFVMPAIAGGTALLGGLMNAFGHKKPSSVKPIQRFGQEDLATMGRLRNRGEEALNFDPVEQRARNQYWTQTVPTLAERFTSMGGSGGAQRSSAFKGAMMGAGADLESQLANLRYQYGLPLLQMGLQPKFDSLYRQSQPGAMQSFGSALGAGGMAALGPSLQGMFEERSLNTLGKMQDKSYSKEMEDLKREVQMLKSQQSGIGGFGGFGGLGRWY